MELNLPFHYFHLSFLFPTITHIHTHPSFTDAQTHTLYSQTHKHTHTLTHTDTNKNIFTNTNKNIHTSTHTNTHANTRTNTSKHINVISSHQSPSSLSVVRGSVLFWIPTRSSVRLTKWFSIHFFQSFFLFDSMLTLSVFVLAFLWLFFLSKIGFFYVRMRSIFQSSSGESCKTHLLTNVHFSGTIFWRGILRKLLRSKWFE
jgi:hypothetical protein